jgi:hypothetical protein
MSIVTKKKLLKAKLSWIHNFIFFLTPIIKMFPNSKDKKRTQENNFI